MSVSLWKVGHMGPGGSTKEFVELAVTFNFLHIYIMPVSVKSTVACEQIASSFNSRLDHQE